MPVEPVKQVLHLPTGFYTYSFKFGGTSAPSGAAMTGCGIKTNASTELGIAQTLGTTFISRLSAFGPSTLTLQEVYVRLGADVGTGVSYTEPYAATGASSSAGASPGVAYLIRHQTGLGGRRGRGRWYLPGVIEPQVDQGGVVLPTFVASVNTALTGMLGDLSTAGIPLAVGHRYPEFFTGPKLVPNVITTSFLDSKVASQRKRQRR
jgi:hypothetical protein